MVPLRHPVRTNSPPGNIGRAVRSQPFPSVGRMAPDIPGIKRAGLPVDLERLAAEGDSWLAPEDRYALKTYGVCAQEQPGVFMIRNRVPGGVLLTEQARGLARLGRIYS